MAPPKAQDKRPLCPQSAGGDNPAKKQKGSPGEEPKPAKKQAARCTKPSTDNRYCSSGGYCNHTKDNATDTRSYV
ncbi:hypothetical protein N7501_004999 [Penicillium viridicatum]|nr:hypothetical protein N7501_004999 [Penicillium viridicatum]